MATSKAGTAQDSASHELIPFPAGTPKPHEARAWGRSLDDVLTMHDGLSHVARGKIPPGLFKHPWSEGAIATTGPRPITEDTVSIMDTLWLPC